MPKQTSVKNDEIEEASVKIASLDIIPLGHVGTEARHGDLSVLGLDGEAC